jgi:hypothetical protein
MAKFRYGMPLMTCGVSAKVAEDKNFAAWVIQCFERHISGDWGDVGKEDWDENEWSLVNGERLFSVYKGDDTIWIITESDRSSTTILFPDEY